MIAGLRVGQQVLVDDDLWTVAAFESGGTVVLVRGADQWRVQHTWLLTHRDTVLVTDVNAMTPGESLAYPWAPGSVVGTLSAYGIDSHAAAEAETRAKHICTFLTGFPFGAPMDPNEVEDLEIGPRSPHGMARRKELLAARMGLGSERQAQRQISAFVTEGVHALVDGRSIRHLDPLAGCPDDLRRAILRGLVRQDQGQDSKMSIRTLALNARNTYVVKHPGKPAPDLKTVMRWVTRARAKRVKTGGSTSSKRGNATPSMESPVLRPASAPFENVIIDSTPLDASLIDPATGKTSRFVFLVARDEYSRAIVAWSLIRTAERSVDIGPLLFQMMTPTRCPESWGPAARWAFGIPEEIVLQESALSPLAHIPFGRVGAVTLDNAKTFTSENTRRVLQVLGISIRLARKGRGSDKGQVERGFRSIGSQFLEWLNSYSGGAPHRRGNAVHARAALFPDEFLDLFGQWVACVYMHTPIRSLDYAT